MMKHAWGIEEELIEWFDRFEDAASRYGREIRIVNPAGEVVGRRLVAMSRYGVPGIGEYYALFEGKQGYSWWIPSPEPVVLIAELPSEVWRFWTGRSLMMYYWDYNPLILPVNGKWRLLERTWVSGAAFCARYKCKRRMIERYEYTLDTHSSKVEWRVCFSTEPYLLGIEVPFCAELWLDGKLVRRHVLLHYRKAMPQDHAFFRPPKAKRRRVEVEWLFSTPLNGYAPPLLAKD